MLLKVILVSVMMVMDAKWVWLKLLNSRWSSVKHAVWYEVPHSGVSFPQLDKYQGSGTM